MTTRLEEIQRRTDLSVTHVTKAVFPPTTNHHNTLFGGTALAWMDEVSFITATRFCRLPLVTVSTDRIDFNHAIPAGSIVELIGRVIKVGNTSLKVEVEVFVESMSADVVVAGAVCRRPARRADHVYGGWGVWRGVDWLKK